MGTSEGYHEYIGENSIMIHLANIMSTLRGYLEYIGGIFSTLKGYHDSIDPKS